MFQEPAESLNPRIRVGETLGEPLRYLGLIASGPRARVRDVVARLGLGQRVLDQFPAELSAGQQQRVGIGRAIVTRPQLIVLDEPTSALDPTARAEIVDLLIRLQRELGTAYLFISHDLSTVRFLSHRVAVLYLGKIVEEADAEALFARPLHPYSVGLLASVLLPNPQAQTIERHHARGRDPEPNRPADRLLAGWPLSLRRRALPHDATAADRGRTGALCQLLPSRPRRGARPHGRSFRPVPAGVEPSPQRRRRRQLSISNTKGHGRWAS